MNLIKSIMAFIGMVFSGTAGGQGKIGGKSLRRFGLPAFATGFALSIRFRWQYLVFLAWIPILSMGYGVDSVLGALLGHCEPLIRFVYALLLSLPFLVFGKVRWAVSVLLLILAFQIQAGSIGYIPWFGDLLLEDVARYSALAILVIVNVLTYKS